MAGNYGHRYAEIETKGSARVHLGDFYQAAPADTYVGNHYAALSPYELELNDNSVTYNSPHQHSYYPGHNYNKTEVNGGFVVQGNIYGPVNLGSSSENQACVDILAWLQPPPRSAPESVTRTAGTNEWFLKGNDFLRWHKGESPALHIHGPVGCGKTILSYSIIEALTKMYLPTRSCVIHFFFSRTDETRQSADSLMKSMLAQICRLSGVPAALKDLRSRCPTWQSKASLKETLLEIMKESTRSMYLVIDGLDELEYGPRRVEVIELLQEIQKLRSEKLHTIATSRSEQDIIAQFKPSQTWKTVVVDTEAISSDIRKHVEDQLVKYPSLECLSDPIKDMILERLCPEKHVMFQWTSLQLDRIKYLRVINSTTVSNLLRDLPRDLDDTYSSVFREIPSWFQNQALMIMRWLILARRQLWAEEIHEICNFIGKQDSLEFEKLELKDIFCLLPSIIIIDPWPRSGSLDGLRPKMHNIFLAHFSIQEFFVGSAILKSSISRFSVQPAPSQLEVAANCVRYLIDLPSQPTYSSSACLRAYAVEYWAIHAVSKAIDTTPLEEAEAERLKAQLRRLVTKKADRDFTFSRAPNIYLATSVSEPDEAELSSMLSFLDETTRAAVMGAPDRFLSPKDRFSPIYPQAALPYYPPFSYDESQQPIYSGIRSHTYSGIRPSQARPQEYSEVKSFNPRTASALPSDQYSIPKPAPSKPRFNPQNELKQQPQTTTPAPKEGDRGIRAIAHHLVSLFRKKPTVMSTATAKGVGSAIPRDITASGDGQTSSCASQGQGLSRSKRKASDDDDDGVD